MKGKRFLIVDVFAENPFSGNQLAVFLGASDLSTEQMQSLALEMGYAESSFILSTEERDGGWDVRIFTPYSEVPFAGHPTLGTAFVIRDVLLENARDDVSLNLKVGRIPVRFERDGDERLLGFMRQKPPEFGPTFPDDSIAAVLGVGPEDLDDRYPTQVVSTGLPFVIVPFRHLEAVRRARLDSSRYDAFVREHDLPAIFFFCPETRSTANQIHARMFAPRLGVPEDPATGSANGCLAGYLVQHRYFGEPAIDVRVEQGFEIRRPSLLRLRASETANEIEIHVGGQVFMIARGELLTGDANPR